MFGLSKVRVSECSLKNGSKPDEISSMMTNVADNENVIELFVLL